MRAVRASGFVLSYRYATPSPRCSASSTIVPTANACTPALSSISVAFNPLSAASACVSCAVVAPTGSTSAGRLRNAIPSPIASKIGNTKIQKIASGSRSVSFSRVTVN